jgi:putative hydrolase of HD superfamily
MDAKLPQLHHAVQILRFYALSEALKTEMRHSWLSNGRQESVAEHTWSLSLLAVLIHPFLSEEVDLKRVLELIAVHDLAEVKTGDIPYFEASTRKEDKAARELDAMRTLATELPQEVGESILSLWTEFESGTTHEAKFARALDHLEVQAQHNLAAFSSWLPIEQDLVYSKMTERCAHDPFLTAFCEAIRSQAEDKMAAAGVDVAAVKERVLQASKSRGNKLRVTTGT